MVAVTINDIGDLLQTIIIAFEDLIFFGFVVMLSFAVAIGIRRVFIGVKL